MLICNGLVSEVRLIAKDVYASYERAKNNKPDGTLSVSVRSALLKSFAVVRRDYVVDTLHVLSDELCCSCAFADLSAMWACLVHS